jgi:hypothetical protein
VLVGNARAFASQLGTVGFGSYETVDVADLDLTAANFKRSATRADAAPARPAALARHAPLAFRSGSRAAYQQAPLAARAPQDARPEDAARAQELLDKAIAAKGGLEKLRDVRTIVARQVLSNQGAETETVNYIEYPDRFRVEAAGTVQGFDGTQAWAQDQRGVHDLPTARDARASLRRDVIALLLAAKNGTLNVRLLPDVKDAEGHVTHTLELSGRDLNPVILYIDPQTSLITKQAFSADGPTFTLVEETFSDYRPVDGVQIAYKATRTVGDRAVQRMVTDVKINAQVDAALFKRPGS